MFRKPIFWLALILVSLGATVFAYRFFPEAFPIVAIDLQMDRQTALASARQLAEKHQWRPEGFKQAASFRSDQEAQHFVELEAGGNEAFRRMLTAGLYSPYAWNVRHFKENETYEVLIRFTPKGEPYGFIQKLPEKEAGAALTADSARAIAESAVHDWQIDLSQYQLAEQSQETRPSGRIDHTFVYERPNVKIGEGRYRLRLVVGGDRLTELTHFIKIPEAFSRRYEEMRSANISITIGSSVAMILLYGIGGCGIGLFFLLRQRFVVWRQPLFWGFFISLLLLLADINQLPLLWMNYDTALSEQSFLLNQIVALLAQFLGWGVVLTASFMAAESLSRRAFPNHLQLWRVWSTNVASSKSVLGLTIGGFLLVGLFFAYNVALYFFATKGLGWWTPSDALINPDVLATYFPWLGAIAVPVQAGFWEESLFRAVPIAGAALIGDKFGLRRPFIVGAMIIQALIFGAGHAAYATQPAYARVVELIIPSLGFGLLYIYLGLLPGIVLHFVFDVVWFALPLFVSSAPGVWIDRTLVIVLTLVPLWIVLNAWRRSGRWTEAGEENYNRAWVPSLKAETAPVVAEVAAPTAISAGTARVLFIAGALGLIAWFMVTPFRSEAPALNTTRSEAEALARKTLAEKGIELSTPWRVLSAVQAQPGEDDRFIWQEGGKENYQKLLGQYLAPPHWRIRFARFEGDVAERAEEYQVYINHQGEVKRIRHELPEARPGDSLTVEAARQIAHTVLATNYQKDPASLKEISAVAAKHPARQDWTFEFSDSLNYPMQQGEARLAVRVAGNQVVDAYRYVHVPEEWSRAERNRRNVPRIVAICCIALVSALAVAGAIGAIVSWSRKNFSAPTFWSFLALLFSLNLIGFINNWPTVVAQFSTAQPYKLQMLILIIAGLVGLLFSAGGLALIVGLVQEWAAQPTSIKTSQALSRGLSLGALLAGFMAGTALLLPSRQPLWAQYDDAGTYLPLLQTGLSPLGGFIFQTVLILLALAAVNRFTNNWSRRKVLFSLPLILLGVILTGARSVESIPSFLGAGVLLGLVLLAAYVFVLRFSLALTPLAMGVITILGTLKQGLYQALPSALPGALMASVLIGLFAFYWFTKLARAQ